MILMLAALSRNGPRALPSQPGSPCGGVGAADAGSRPGTAGTLLPRVGPSKQAGPWDARLADQSPILRRHGSV